MVYKLVLPPTPLIVVNHGLLTIIVAVCFVVLCRLCCRYLGDPLRLQLRLRHVFPPFRWHVFGSALALDNHGIFTLNIKGVANDVSDLIGFGVFLARFCGRSCSAHFVSVSPRPIGGHRPTRLISPRALAALAPALPLSASAWRPLRSCVPASAAHCLLNSPHSCLFGRSSWSCLLVSVFALRLEVCPPVCGQLRFLTCAPAFRTFSFIGCAAAACSRPALSALCSNIAALVCPSGCSC